MDEAPTIRPVTPALWPDLERFFEGSGRLDHCWCMVWRLRGAEARAADRAARKAGLRARVAAGEPAGLLAYVGGAPVAWCSVAPRACFHNLGGPDDHRDEPAAVWSLTCFFVAPAHRGRGLSDALLRAAAAHARARGARLLEAYPVDPGSPSYRFMGFVPQLRRHGFSYVQDAGTRRRVHRLEL